MSLSGMLLAFRVGCALAGEGSLAVNLVGGGFVRRGDLRLITVSLVTVPDDFDLVVVDSFVPEVGRRRTARVAARWDERRRGDIFDSREKVMGTKDVGWGCLDDIYVE